MDLPLIPPMLATPGTLPPPAQDARWAYETKQDGQRVVVYLPGDGSLRLRARSGQDITAAYPELRPLATALGSTPAVLDGEILALDDRGRADFQLLQSRMGLAHDPALAARRAARVPVHLVLFDALHLSGRSLVSLAYTRRRGHLEDLGLDGPSWSTPAALVGHGEQALRATREHGLEGLVCKRLDSVYEPGVRSRSWIKIRNMRTEDVIVGGWLPGKGRLTGLPGRCWWGSGPPGGCATWAGWAPAGARPNAPNWRRCCGPPRPTSAPSTRCPRRRERTGWCPAWWERSGSAPAPVRACCASRPGSGCART